MPASLHGGAGVFTFADGHSEPKKWQDGRTKLPVRQQPWSAVAAGTSADYQWMVERMPQ